MGGDLRGEYAWWVQWFHIVVGYGWNVRCMVGKEWLMISLLKSLVLGSTELQMAREIIWNLAEDTGDSVKSRVGALKKDEMCGGNTVC